MFLMLRKRQGDSEAVEYVTDSTGRTVPINTLTGEPVAEIDTEDKNEVKKKIERFVGLKPETVAQLLKTWINED
jgi:flagellar biosynthesis/type III secretory pathway M-ring protein FliF/YscJ